MESVELRKTHWQLSAEKLFRDEYEVASHFYKKFDSPTALYSELAQRVVALTKGTEGTGAEAYQLMYQSYMHDASRNTYEALDELTARFTELTEN